MGGPVSSARRRWASNSSLPQTFSGSCRTRSGNAPVFRTHSEEETIELGAKLARQLPSRAVVLLTGNLGAGKTTLAKGIVKGLGAAEPDEVSSPTFTLIHEYGDPPRVYHVDLYRLDDPRAADTLGLEELFEQDAVALIEWGEKFPQLWPPSHIEVDITVAGAGERRIRVSGLPHLRL
jgi:tRNA threonylcarbamoyladenosine biosynthesis protein TsaE